jgi:hypothetical protein
MSFNREQDQHEAILGALHHLANTIEKGFLDMADLQAQALADLATAVTNIGTAITAEIAALQAALAGNVPPVNDSPAIEAAVTNLNNLAASLTASLPPATAAATPAAKPAS